MVAITGSLAVDNAEAGEDVDYLIVTKPGRVWTARAFTIAVVRLARLARIELCPNFIVSEDSLALPEGDAYVARELVQMQPVSGSAVAQRMLDESGWWRTFLPNASTSPATKDVSSGWLQRLPELMLGGRIGDSIEKAILTRKGGELRRLTGDTTEAIFDESMCKGHVDGHHQRIQTALRQRLHALGLEEH
jgi:hypothetical protein